MEPFWFLANQKSKHPLVKPLPCVTEEQEEEEGEDEGQSLSEGELHLVQGVTGSVLDNNFFFLNSR